MLNAYDTCMVYTWSTIKVDRNWKSSLFFCFGMFLPIILLHAGILCSLWIIYPVFVSEGYAQARQIQVVGMVVLGLLIESVGPLVRDFW